MLVKKYFLFHVIFRLKYQFNIQLGKFNRLIVIFAKILLKMGIFCHFGIFLTDQKGHLR